MELMIKKKALKLLLHVLISCRCPINEKIEKELVRYYLSNASQDVIDYTKILEISNKDRKDTPFSRLKEFFLYSFNDFSKVAVISSEDVIRHFCTSYHWNLTERSLAASYRNLINIPTWFIGHMLLPVSLKKDKKTYSALYHYGNKNIIIKNIFLPKEIEFNSDDLYCVHFALVISTITEQNNDLIKSQLEEINSFKNFRDSIKEINYLEYQRYGNYYEICRSRYLKHFPE